MLIKSLLKVNPQGRSLTEPPEKADVKGDLTNVKRFESVSVVMIAG